MPDDDIDLRFYFVRHGEAEKANSGDTTPSSPLSERGRSQARALARRLLGDGVRFDRIYSSTLPRAVQTTELLLDGLGLPSEFRQVEDLVEWRKGEWEGTPWPRLCDDELRARMAGNIFFFVPPGGESYRMVQRRVVAWLEDAVLYEPELRGRSRTLLVVCHGIVIRAVLQHVLGYHSHLIRRLGASNTAITELGFDADGWSMERYNDAAHLADVDVKSGPRRPG